MRFGMMDAAHSPGGRPALLDRRATAILLLRLAVVFVSFLIVACRAADPAKRIDALLAPLSSDHAPGAAVMGIREGAVAYPASIANAGVGRALPTRDSSTFTH